MSRAASMRARGTSAATPICCSQASVPSTPTGAEPTIGRPARRKLAIARRIERVDRRHGDAIEGGVQFAPLAGRHRGAGGESERLEERGDRHRVGGKHLPHRSDGRSFRPPTARRQHRTLLGFQPRIAQHRPRQDVLRLGVRRDAEARDVDADDAHAVDLAREQPQRDAGRRRHAQVCHHDRVVLLRISRLVHRFPDVLEQLPRDQGLGVERDVAHRAPRAVEVRGEGEPVHAAGGAGENRRRAAHAQSDAQRTERGTHRLRLVVRPLWIVARILLERVTRPGVARRALQLHDAGVTSDTIGRERGRIRDVLRRRRQAEKPRPFRGRCRPA